MANVAQHQKYAVTTTNVALPEIPVAEMDALTKEIHAAQLINVSMVHNVAEKTPASIPLSSNVAKEVQVYA